MSQSKVDGIVAFVVALLGAFILIVGIYKDRQDSREFADLRTSVHADRADLASHHLTPPRILAQEQQAALTASARPFSGIHASVVSMSDSESFNFATQIAKALQGGGLILDGTRDGTADTHASVAGRGPTTEAITIVAPSGRQDAARALRTELHRAGFDVATALASDIGKGSDVVVFVGDAP